MKNGIKITYVHGTSTVGVICVALTYGRLLLFGYLGEPLLSGRAEATLYSSALARVHCFETAVGDNLLPCVLMLLISTLELKTLGHRFKVQITGR